MRLLQLDLEKYGSFEASSLAFRPDARLHLVYGPNEAGKSSALAAVSDLLFGFGQKTGYAFRHATTDLRLGATIASSSGEKISFRRRKGNKDTLVGPDDKPLRDDLLLPYLGQLSRETFQRAFGLDADSLREGAEELLASGGESGASLFAAASGLRGVEELRRALDGEADALFTPQARQKPFNEIARRHEAARIAQRDSELGATQWKRLNDEIEALEERHRGFEAARGKSRTERARLERLARAHGASVELARARAALAAYAAAPDLAPGVADQISARLEAADAAEAAQARANEALRLAEFELGGVAVDEAALGVASEVEALMVASGAYLSFQTDIPRVRREAEGLDEALARLAVRLGLADGRAIETAMPTDAARAGLKELIGEGRALALARDQRDETIAAERERLAALTARRGESDASDPKPLREAFAGLAAKARPLDRLAETRAERDQETRALSIAASRLSPPVDDLARLAGRPLPAADAISRVRREQDGLASDMLRAQEAAERDRTEGAKLDAELARLDALGPIATPDAIRAARAAREAAWAPLRAHLAGASSLDETARAEKVEAFARAVAHADALADRLAEDAARAARKEDLARQRVALAAGLDMQAGRIADLKARREEADAAWEELWSATGVKPGQPEGMEAWRREALALFERLERNAERDAIVGRLEAVEQDLRRPLERLAATIGVEAEADGGLLPLAARIEERLAALADGWAAASALATQTAEIERRLERLGREATEAALREDAWRVRWAAALPGLGLSPTATPSSAEAALSAWGEAPALAANRAALLQRIHGMERDSEAFRRGVAAEVAACAPDLSDLPAEIAARKLNERVAAARTADARKSEALRRRDEAKAAAERAGRAVEAAKATLAEAAENLVDAGELRPLLALLAARDAALRDVADKRARLMERGEAADETALLAELETFEPDAAPAEIDRLGEEERHIDAEAQQAWADLHAARARRDALGGAEAERAAAEGRAAGAALHAVAREWSVKKLASLLLGAAIERARTEDRSPVLERAGALFSTLTGGVFLGFAEAYEDDAIVLSGARTGGEKVPIAGMSEGTRDQFYLALRLASIEDYAARAEPAPFIGDDLFATFDDERTAHGLKALAEIGATVQTILFTHHRAVVESARKTLGGAVDVIEIEAVRRSSAA